MSTWKQTWREEQRGARGPPVRACFLFHQIEGFNTLWLLPRPPPMWMWVCKFKLCIALLMRLRLFKYWFVLMGETENECSIRISRRLIYFGNGLNPFVCSLVSLGEKSPVAQTQLLRPPFGIYGSRGRCSEWGQSRSGTVWLLSRERKKAPTERQRSLNE